jgi:hypothetical protein
MDIPDDAFERLWQEMGMRSYSSVYGSHQIGDIIFSHEHGDKSSRLILLAQSMLDQTPAEYSHVAICLSPGIFVHAVPHDEQSVPTKGASYSVVENYFNIAAYKDNLHALTLPKISVLRLTALSQNYWAPLQKAILYLFGQEYTFRFLMRPGRDTGTTFCSRFVVQILRRSGISLSDLGPSHGVTPSKLHRALFRVSEDVTPLYHSFNSELASSLRERELLAEDVCRSSVIQLINLSTQSAVFAADAHSHVRRLYENLNILLSERNRSLSQESNLLNNVTHTEGAFCCVAKDMLSNARQICSSVYLKGADAANAAKLLPAHFIAEHLPPAPKLNIVDVFGLVTMGLELLKKAAEEAATVLNDLRAISGRIDSVPDSTRVEVVKDCHKVNSLLWKVFGEGSQELLELLKTPYVAKDTSVIFGDSGGTLHIGDELPEMTALASEARSKLVETESVLREVVGSIQPFREAAEDL